MKNQKRRNKISRFEVDEHLGDYLKTSYAQRLAWLEKAMKFFQRIKSARQDERALNKL